MSDKIDKETVILRRFVHFEEITETGIKTTIMDFSEIVDKPQDLDKYSRMVGT
jgi:acyl-[acyl carrier protein]--UDP-N-acetylglucosamine O-acyltransferase